jgi:hypothetical protein
MTWDDTTVLLATAMGCAALAAWLTGALVQLRLIRSARAGGRRVLRITLPIPADQADGALAASLGASGHYLLSFTGRMEQTLMAEIHSPGSASSRPVAILFLRVDDLGDGQSRAQIRLDFGDLIERVRRGTAIVLLAIWPVWILAVATGIALAFARAGQPNPWLVLHGFHATYPLVAMLILLSRYHHWRRRIGNAVSAALRTVRHARQ